jgi:hypothetical protein
MPRLTGIPRAGGKRQVAYFKAPKHFVAIARARLKPPSKQRDGAKSGRFKLDKPRLPLVLLVCFPNT